MYPIGLDHSEIVLPESSDKNIVLLSYNALRHERFAYRMKKIFGNQVVAWYRIDENCKPRYCQIAINSQKLSQKAKLVALARNVRKFSRRPGKIALAQSAYYVLRQELDRRLFGYEVNREEQRMFGPELERLKKTVELTSINVHPADVSTSEFVHEIRKINPYFFLSIDGSFFNKELLDCVRALVINQHNGHLPDYAGMHATERALYHRDLSCVSSTIHVLTKEENSGLILRRSSPCIFPVDNAATIFLRVAALGSELMMESVRDMIAKKSVVVFSQSPEENVEYTGENLPPHILRSVYRDFRNGWLEDELILRSKF